MTSDSPWRPGPYPTLYVCRVCQAMVKKKEIVAGRARPLDHAQCVCPACLPRWKEQERERVGQPPLADNEAFVALIASAQEDATIRQRVLAIARLNAFNRESLLNTLLADLTRRGAPGALIESLSALKYDDIALRVREVLERE